MRHTIRKCALAFLAVGLTLLAALAQDYPIKSIRMILPVPPGGGMDLAARLIQEKLGDKLGQQIVIEYRPGANGAIGSEVVAKAAPDGYTLLFFSDDLFTIPSLMPKMTFDANKELVPIATVSSTPLVIFAAATAPFSNVKELLDVARASPAGLSYAIPGLSVNHVAAQWIAVAAQVTLRPVPYRGGPDTVLAIISGEVPFGIVSPSTIFPAFVDAGKVKVIALTGKRRPSFAPRSWPTLAENGLPVDVKLRLGLFAPMGTPSAVVARLDRAIDLVLQDDFIRQRMSDSGLSPEHIDHVAYAERIRNDEDRYEQIIRQTGIRMGQ